ncbi:3-deoxy-manno-octulosonate cytidylyltransferase [Psittacicella gerlachiana]|uniref:3-deoxy-manno-octulosonate cytidylyltransferase n=1 Tax=Psittacicella gerlachiana TaxID=2028574 RepID=A0A3A1YKC3_9GAMM|nr:3-deoxy-manno-octulosonate cytidylyltransferase [Psittacicella gerlachiana]RIY37490.1 3-deoxy-manno-octulosonate cytidylyltransferase [Psittacicella gerlachiana]
MNKLEGLVCPLTKQPLYHLDENHVATADKSHIYLIEDGIFRLKASQHHYRIVIPSRLASTRLPNKPLQAIDDWNLINTVVYSALQTGLDVIVATDSPLIEESLEQFAQEQQLADRITVVQTDPELENGTERIAQALDKLELSDDEIIVNVQGDEPFFNPEILNDLVSHFVEVEAKDPQIKMATIGQLAHEEEITSPNAVKVVTDKYGRALYFSRNPIPYPRSLAQEQIKYIKHAGVYVYRAKFIREYKALPMTPLATAESLEQLKVLEHGYKIALMMIQGRGFIGVDTAEDLALAQKIKQDYWQQAPANSSPQNPDQTSYRQFLTSFGQKYLP